MAKPWKKVWSGYGFLNRRGTLRVVLHELDQSPLEISIYGVAPQKDGATVFLVRAKRQDPPSTVES